jgi:CBS domain-containing protein
MTRRVLVVDDNRSLGRMIGELLVEAGAEARVFDTSRRALEWARANRIDAALVNLDMPEIDGARLLELVREVHPDARRFLMTCTVDDARIARLASSVASVFRKPFLPARVVDALVPRAKGIDVGPGRVVRTMSRPVTSCTPEDDVAEAARLMWDDDRGFLVVLDGRGKLVGVITDRDICMAAYTRGRALHQISVASAMSRDVRTCALDDTLEQAACIMREARVRRLPVVDPLGSVAGVISLADIAAAGEATAATVVDTLASIAGPRAKRVKSKVA